MQDLSFYRAISNLLGIKYRHKILLIVFLGTEIPLFVIAGLLIREAIYAGSIDFKWIAAAIAATLATSLLTLIAIDRLLQPVLLTARSLTDYAYEGILPQLPTEFTDEAGTLMADTQRALMKLAADVRQLTDFDDVTGLPNRQTFMRILKDGMETEPGLALCAFHVSNYHKIAAAFGQSAINSVLIATAERFREQLGEDMPLSRIGANTFILALGLPPTDLAVRIESIRLALEKELHLPESSLRLEMNAGVSLHAGGPLEAERLINEALSATAQTYVESAVHTNFFSPKRSEQARDVFLIERDIRIAIEEEQFSVHYQPIVNTALGKVVGAEALVRWNHPERGMVSPLTFIPVAEASGLMDAIGMRVLQQVCRQLGGWAGTPLQDVKVSINLSARQFLNPDAVTQIAEALAINHVSPHNLEIELTETTVIQDTERTLAILRVLRQMGITIAIDDFGTGYSGLSYLKTLPFDRLKIDREFIQNVDQTITSKAICKSLIELASGLGIEVLAEGTETAAEVGMMRSLGCGLYQGYHFARPLPADQFLNSVHLIEAKLEDATQLLRAKHESGLHLAAV